MEEVEGLRFNPSKYGGEAQFTGILIPVDTYQTGSDQQSRPVVAVGRATTGQVGVFKGREISQNGGHLWKHFIDVKPAKSSTVKKTVELVG